MKNKFWLTLTFLALFGFGFWLKLAFFDNKSADSKNFESKPMSSQLCDIGPLEDYLKEVLTKSCENNNKSVYNCLTFSWTDALTMAPFLASGGGGIIAAAGRMTIGGAAAGISSKETKELSQVFGETNSESKIRSMRAQYGYSCSEYSWFMVLKEDMPDSDDFKFREEEHEASEKDEKTSELNRIKSELCTRQSEITSDGLFAFRKNEKQREISFKLCKELQPDVTTEECKYKPKAVVNRFCRKYAQDYFCTPQNIIRGKTIQFLQMPREKREALLCSSAELYSYYQNLLHNFIDDLRSHSKVTHLKCEGTLLKGFQTQVGEQSYLFKTFTNDRGELTAALGRPHPIEKLPEYSRWIEMQKAKEQNRPGSTKNDTLYISESLELKPGEMYLTFNQKNAGDHLSGTTFVYGNDFSKHLVRMKTTDFSDFLRQFSGKNYGTNLKNLSTMLSHFYLQNDIARSCCAEKNPGRRDYCLKELGGTDSAATDTKVKKEPLSKSSKKRLIR